MTDDSANRQNNDVIAVLYAAIDDLNEGLAADKRLDRSPDTRLFGDGATLDSLGFVNLVLAIEQRLNDGFGTSIPLAETLMADSQTNPPDTVSRLADFIGQLLKRSPA